jgi:hypothetical protein
MNEETYILDEKGMEQYMTKGAHAMLEHLEKIGLITEEKSKEFQRTKIVLIRKKSQICQLWKKVFRINKSEVKHVLIATLPDLGDEDA